MTTTLTIMTYNVHSCVGRDGVSSPERIADIIARFGADVIALQELDQGLARTGSTDQARDIADLLSMSYHFHATLRIGTGAYGTALLSRPPMRLVRAQELPSAPAARPFEKRGAVWAAVSAGGREFQVLNTHLGLDRRDRLLQTGALLGPGWLGDPACRAPVVFCGDLNAGPRSVVYRQFAGMLRDAQRVLPGRLPGGTWPSGFPLVRIDHVFVSSGIAVRDVIVPRDKAVRAASDHLPVVVRMDLGPEEAGVTP